ncbi:39S ribosomal protein L35, mitochondrial [Hylaeus anthracinus]|uniref:39S ribosomal protein L35, mitochondrial n=1 Tax=Hylaeus anthracinus TaxID=313031 RepID=UPI0023B9E053|nr:39S ribosomal protein L35, mitochondrial [Hylaeus anthracinus]
MLRIVSTAIRGIVARTNTIGVANLLTSKQYPLVQCAQQKYFGALSSVVNGWNNVGSTELKLNITPSILPVTVPARSITKFSLLKGKRKSARTVLKRFYRLNWGIWIRTRAGRHSHLWTKTQNRKHRLRQHVFCNATQSTLLDKMVTRYWKRPHYYVDDPYNPYHSREEFPLTRRKPLP